MKKALWLVIIILLLLGLAIYQKKPMTLSRNEVKQNSHWLLLYRKSNQEYLYYGTPGKISESALIKKFTVKTGIPGERPTPLPNLLGRDYWILKEKHVTPDSPETAPYFLTLDVPVTEDEPYGPTPYLECNGQCNWILPGAFGLHGTSGDPTKLSSLDPGSSGCIRHQDVDITYLYKTLDPQKEEIRYYIKDN